MYKTIVVHDRVFHADDVICVALAKYLNPDISIIRTRDEEVIKLYQANENALVCDVGKGDLDHHQQNVKVFDDNRKYASCAILYEKLIDEGLLKYDATLMDMMRLVSYFDNAQDTKDDEANLITKLCRTMNPCWNEELAVESQFYRAIQLTLSYIEGVLDDNDEFLNDLIKEIDEIIEERDFIYETSLKEAEKIVKTKLKEQGEEKRYLMFDHYIPYTSLWDTNIDFIINCDDENKMIYIYAVPDQENSRKCKIPIPEEYQDQLSYRYPSGFLASINIDDRVSKAEAIEKACRIVEDIERRYR